MGKHLNSKIAAKYDTHVPRQVCDPTTCFQHCSPMGQVDRCFFEFGYGWTLVLATSRTCICQKIYTNSFIQGVLITCLSKPLCWHVTSKNSTVTCQTANENKCENIVWNCSCACRPHSVSVFVHCLFVPRCATTVLSESRTCTLKFVSVSVVFLALWYGRRLGLYVRSVGSVWIRGNRVYARYDRNFGNRSKKSQTLPKIGICICIYK